MMTDSRSNRISLRARNRLARYHTLCKLIHKTGQTIARIRKTRPDFAKSSGTDPRSTARARVGRPPQIADQAAFFSRSIGQAESLFIRAPHR